MFSLPLKISPRFAVLFLLCTLSTQWLAPIRTVQAVAVARAPAPRRTSHRQITRGGVDHQANQHNQRYLPYPHAPRAGGSYHHHKRMPSNPFSKFAEAVFSGIRKKGRNKGAKKEKRGHKAIVIPSTHGDAFMVSHARRAAGTPQWLSQPRNASQPSASGNSSTMSAQDASDAGTRGTQTPGTVNIVSHSDNQTEENGKPIAALYLTNLNGSYVLNASDSNSTELYLVDAPSSTSRTPTAANNTEDSPVNLMIPGFQNDMDYCATYNVSPKNPEPMTFVQCFDKNTGTAATDANGTHASQTFLYNKNSGVIRPTWFAGEDDGTHDTTSASAAAADDGPTSLAPSSSSSFAAAAYTPAANSSSTYGAAAASDTSSSASSTVSSAAAADVTSSSALPTPTSPLSAREYQQHRGQNVTLVFVPTRKANAADVDSSGTNSTSSNSTASAAAAQDGSAASNSTSTSVNGAATGLSVELVGDGSISSSSAPVSSSTAAPAESSSVNAAAVAASIAASASSASAAATSTATPSGQSANAADAPSSSSSIPTAPATTSVVVAAASDTPSPSSSSNAPTTTTSVVAAAAAAVDTPSASLSSTALVTSSVGAAAVPDSSSSSTTTTDSPGASPTGADAAGVADSFSTSASSSSTIQSGASSSATYVAAVMQREAAPAPRLTPVTTAPYTWRFSREQSI